MPTKILALRGSVLVPRRRKRGEPTPTPDTSVPGMPAWLTEQAKPFWAEISEELLPLGILTATDHLALGILADTMAEYLAARGVIEKDGAWAPTEKGTLAPHPAVSAMHKAREQLIKLLNHFGMTPSSRTQLSVTPNAYGSSKKPKQPRTKARLFTAS